MKIAIDISQIIYGTGVSVYTRNLVTNLIKLYPNDQFLLFGGSLRRQNELKIFSQRLKAESKIFPFPPKLADLIWNSFHLFPIEKIIGQVDLIHTSDWVEPPSQIPKVTTVHDLVPFKYKETTQSDIYNTHRKKIAWVCRESQAIFAVSESTKKDLVQDLHLDHKKIFVTLEGVESFYRPQPPSMVDQVKKRYGLTGDYLMCLSTIEPRKNQSRLIQAYLEVKKKYPDLKLLIGGRTGWGDIPKPVDGVFLPGFIPDADLPALYTGCEAFVLPSLYEGFSLAHLSAMACGAPVVGSNLSSMPEVIGRSGVLVDPKSVEDITAGIIKAVQNKFEFKEKSLKRASLFSWEETARLTHQVYESVFNNK